MYKKNQDFINFYRELESQKTFVKSSPHFNTELLDPIPIDTLNQLYDTVRPQPLFNIPSKSNSLTEFKNLLLSVQLSHKYIPSVHLQQQVFDEKNIPHNEQDKKRTAGYNPTVLLTNPLLRPF